jgi:MFS family permease
LAIQDRLQRPVDGSYAAGNRTFWNTTFSSLAERDFAWFFAGNFAFFMAIQMQFILFGYLTYDLTGSAKAIGLVSAAIALPTLFAGPVSGAIADRVNKRVLLAATQGVAIAVSLGIGLLVIGGSVRFWHLVAAAFVVGLLMSLNMPTRQAMVPQLVPRHKLTNAISLQMGEMNLTRILAPALAGLLIAPLGPGWVYLLAAGLLLSASLMEMKLPKHGMTGHSGGTRLFDDVREGFGYIWRHQTIRLLIATSIFIPMLSFPVQQMLPIFARDVFHKGPAGLGLLSAMSGVGGLTGAILAANLDRQPDKGRLLLLGGITMGVSLVTFALSPLFELSLVFLSLAAIGQLLFVTTNNTVIQANLPGEMRGRVLAVMMMSFGLSPVGVVPVTVAADAVGAPATIAFSAALLLASLLVLFLSSPRLRSLRLDLLERAELSPIQAATLVAEGKLTEAEARQLSGAQAESLEV